VISTRLKDTRPKITLNVYIGTVRKKYFRGSKCGLGKQRCEERDVDDMMRVENYGLG